MSYILTISTSTEVFKLVEHVFAEKAPLNIDYWRDFLSF